MSQKSEIAERLLDALNKAGCTALYHSKYKDKALTIIYNQLSEIRGAIEDFRKANQALEANFFGGDEIEIIARLVPRINETAKQIKLPISSGHLWNAAKIFHDLKLKD